MAACRLSRTEGGAVVPAGGGSVSESDSESSRSCARKAVLSLIATRPRDLEAEK